MNLPGAILHYAGIEGQQVADVARGWIGNAHNLRRVHGAGVGGLFGIDSGADAVTFTCSTTICSCVSTTRPLLARASIALSTAW